MINFAKKNPNKVIMRRIWYSYLISVFLRLNTLLGFAFGASVIGFWKLVSVTSIINNMLAVRVGSVPQYILQSLLQAEALALLSFGIVVFTILSIGIRFTLPVIRTHNLSSI